MKIGIMQPYLLPYIGYFQLINSVDKFVLYDDVNFIKGGWINRNRLLLNGQPSTFTLPLDKASSFKAINELTILDDHRHRQKILKSIELAYKRAKCFDVVYPLLYDALIDSERNLVTFIHNIIKKLMNYLKIQTPILLSSDINKKNELTGFEKVIEICHKLEGNSYINPIGGKELYDQEIFNNNGLKLFFFKTNENIKYKQFNNDFIANLSIVDVLMFNDVDSVSQLLNNYELVS